MQRRTEERVFIAGAGPVGMVAAACLVRHGIPVTVFETAANLSKESRASTFHPSSLDILDELGFTDELVASGMIARRLQYRSEEDGIIATFDFSAISDLTRHPYRLHCEQFNLTRIIHSKLSRDPHFNIEFGMRVCGVAQDEDSVTVKLAGPDSTTSVRRGRWLIGADGGRSEVRKALGISFEGFTWPERFLVVTTPFDFGARIPGIDPVTYVSASINWHVLLQIPSMWRVTFPVDRQVANQTASSRDFAEAALAAVAPGAQDCAAAHFTLYNVHQRVAKTFRLGRACLAGDAAHINNPLGGMGMNGGIHDAVNLAQRLTRVWRREADDTEMDRYDRQRRLVTLEHIQNHTIHNKRDIEAHDPRERVRFRNKLSRIASDPPLTRDFLRTVSMIASLERAAELG